MADYDASIRVNTKVDKGDLKAVQKEVDNLTKQLDKLRARSAKIEVLGGTEKQFASIGYDTEIVEDKLAAATARLEELKVVSGETGGFEKIRGAAKRFFGVVSEGARESNGLFATMRSRLKGIALSLLVFNWITKGFNAMVAAMREGFQNLARYSNDYNESMSALKSQTAQLKNGLAAAFEPVANMMIPYLTQMVSWLNIATDAMAQFFAALQGKSTYTRAKKQAVDYAKSLNETSKAAKGALAAFDSLNVLDKGESGLGATGALSGAAAFEEAELNPEILVMLEKAKALLEIIKPLVIAVGIALLMWKVAEFLTNLGQISTNLWDAYAIISLLAGIVLMVYEYISMWFNGVNWEGIIGYIAGVALAVTGLYMLLGPTAAGIGVLVAGVAGLVLAFKDMTSNGITAQNMTLALISAVGILVGILVVFGSTAAMVVGAVMAVIAIFAGMIAITGNGEEAIGTLWSMCKNFADFFKKIFAGDIKGAMVSLKAAGKDLVNVFIISFESLVNCLIMGLNWLIERINTISFEVPDWVPVIGGRSVGFNLGPVQEVSLPRLAEGAVIQGGRPFAAILGDQRFGQTNIETPLDTMVEAFRSTISDMGLNAGGYNGPVYLQVDGKTFAKLELPYIRQEEKRIGVSLKMT